MGRSQPGDNQKYSDYSMLTMKQDDKVIGIQHFPGNRSWYARSRDYPAGRDYYYSNIVVFVVIVVVARGTSGRAGSALEGV